MLTDTGNFLYPNTTDEALEIASEMLDYGAQFPKIVSDTWRNKDFITMKIWGLALANLKINPRYNFAVTILPYQELQSIFKDLAMEDYHFEGDSLAGFLSNLSGVKGLLLLREESPGKLKGSLRSAQKNIDVSKLARFLGGGGHAKSSGFTITGNIQKNNNYYKII
jgi:phosphoesterase RecJ-like protein